MSRLPTTGTWPKGQENSSLWLASHREGSWDRPPQASTRLPRDVELRLIRGLLAERDRPLVPEDDRALARTTASCFLAGLTLWAGALYGLWSILA